MYVPDDSPDVCPACGDGYESVSRHAGGFVVNLLDNERYARVCFYPIESEAGNAELDCYHHAHAGAAETNGEATAAGEPTPVGEPTVSGEATAERDGA